MSRSRRMPRSLLLSSLGERLAVAAGLGVALWLTAAWAMDWL